MILILLEKCFIVHMQKQPEHEMIMSLAKPFKEKMREQFVKI